MTLQEQRVVDDAFYVFEAWAERPEYGLWSLPRMFEALRELDPDRYRETFVRGVEAARRQ